MWNEISWDPLRRFNFKKERLDARRPIQREEIEISPPSKSYHCWKLDDLIRVKLHLLAIHKGLSTHPTTLSIGGSWLHVGMPFIHLLYPGMDADRINPFLWVSDWDPEETDAEGRSRGVPILLEFSLANCDGSVEAAGCNSIPLYRLAVGGSSSSCCSSSTEQIVLVSVYMVVESSVVPRPCLLFFLTAFPHPWIVSRILCGIRAAL